MAELASAYVQIVPSAKGISGSISKLMCGEASSAGASAGSVLGGSLVGTLTKVVAAAGIGKLISNAISAGADLEQSIGGIETLFGTGGATNLQQYAQSVGKSVYEVKDEFEALSEAQEVMLKNADEAYRTAGMSANDYMQTVSGFAASLKQSVGGDTEALTTAANQAVIDMSDNANKMGTDMTLIQNAYQGFAKQNYTMLDNLKLGYGGTKTEMERLLSDAEKITGTKYDLGNLSDVYAAIHVIQDELGITGTTSKEAASTISGSAASMKASFNNLLAKLTLGDDVSDEMSALVESVNTFLFNNLLPAFGNIADQLPAAIDTFMQAAVPVIKEKVLWALGQIPALIKEGAGASTDLMSSILTDLLAFSNGESDGGVVMQVANSLMAILQAAIESLGTMAVTLAPQVAELAKSLFDNLVTGIQTDLPTIGAEGSQAITEFLNGIQPQLPAILQQGIDIIMYVVDGILQSLPTIISTAGQLISSFVAGIMPMIPDLLSAGVDLVNELIAGCWEAAPDIVIAAGDLVIELVGALVENFPQIVSTGSQLPAKLVEGIISNLPKIAEGAKTVFNHFKKKFAESDFGQMAHDLIQGLITGIKNKVGELSEAASAIVSGLSSKLKEKLKIGSPSKLMRDEIGIWIPLGIAEGIDQTSNVVNDSVSNLVDETNRAVDGALPVLNSNSSIMMRSQVQDDSTTALAEKVQALGDVMSSYLPVFANGQNVNVTLEGDAKSIFRAVRRESKTYKVSTGRSAFA